MENSELSSFLAALGITRACKGQTSATPRKLRFQAKTFSFNYIKLGWFVIKEHELSRRTFQCSRQVLLREGLFR